MHPAVILLAAALAAHAWAAEAPGEILQRRRQQDALIDVYVRTRHCMETAGVAALSRNEGRPAHVRAFMVSACGDPMRGILVHDGMDAARAAATMERLARTSYYEDVLRVPEPPYDPSNPSE